MESRKQQPGKQIFCLQTSTPDPGDEVEREKIQLSKNVHVAYQIKRNDACSNMVANILPADTHDPGDGVKFYF